MARKTSQSFDSDHCPYCGQNILKGAMRCVSCGKMLKTPEEQKAAIDHVIASRKKFRIASVIRIIVFLIIIGVVYYFFAGQLSAVIKKLLGS